MNVLINGVSLESPWWSVSDFCPGGAHSGDLRRPFAVL